MNYLSNILIQFSLYLTCALSLNLLLGYCGLFSLCHAALFGLGAYTTALLMTKAGWAFMPAALASISVGCISSLAVSVTAGRLKGDAFALCTLAFQIVAIDLINNLVDLTGGPFGISGIPAPSLFGTAFHGSIFVFIAVPTACLALYTAWAIDHSPFGRTMLATRNDELAARTLGKNVFMIRVVACIVAGGIVALGGSLYASYFGYIDPTAFLIGESFVILTMVVMGGSGNIIGPVLGAAVMVFVPELLRLLNIPGTAASGIKQMIFGALLVLLMLIRPQGLWGRYKLK